MTRRLNEKTKYRLMIVGLLLVTGCSIPLYDRAEIAPGPTTGVGLSLSTGYWGHSVNREALYIAPYLGIIGTFRVNYGISEHFGYLFQPSLGLAASKSGSDPIWSAMPIYDIQLGAKLRTSKNGALQTTLGYPGLLDLLYIHDFNQNFTGTVGIGFRGISLGMTTAAPINRSLNLYLAGNIVSGWNWLKLVNQPTASLGIGFGIKPER